MRWKEEERGAGKKRDLDGDGWLGCTGNAWPVEASVAGVSARADDGKAVGAMGCTGSDANRADGPALADCLGRALVDVVDVLRSRRCIAGLPTAGSGGRTRQSKSSAS